MANRRHLRGSGLPMSTGEWACSSTLHKALTRSAASEPTKGEKTSMIMVGIPAHNEEKTIGTVVASARNFADLVVVCDDGSTDRTATVASQYGAMVERHGSNLGYG